MVSLKQQVLVYAVMDRTVYIHIFGGLSVNVD